MIDENIDTILHEISQKIYQVKRENKKVKDISLDKNTMLSIKENNPDQFWPAYDLKDPALGDMIFGYPITVTDHTTQVISVTPKELV